MSAISLHAASGPLDVPRQGRWRRRVIDPADIPGAVVCVVPLLLGVFLSTGIREAEFAIYAICVMAVLPYLAPFIASTRRNPANAALLVLFVALGVATVAASPLDTASSLAQSKSLAATIVWASIYIVVFSAVRSAGSGIVISGSVYLSVALHLAGVGFGEVLEFRDGSFRAFGPLGDQVAFIVILPALISLSASRPVGFGVHFGALLLTATRGAILSLAVGVVAYLFVVASSKTRLRSITWGVISLCVAGLLAATPVSSVLIDRIVSSPTNESYSFRWTAAAAGLELLQEHPVLGVGVNGFADRRHAVAEDWLSTPGTQNALSRAANQYVQTATDGGLLAAAALLLFVGFTLLNARRATKWVDATPELVGTQVWLIGVLVGNQGALWLLSDASSGFFMLAIAAIAARVAMLARHNNAVAA